MTVLALADGCTGKRGLGHGALDHGIGLVVNRRALGADLDPVALFQVADPVGQGRQGHGVGPEEHLALAVADRQRAAPARADHQVVAPGEDDGQREGAFQALQGVGHRLLRRLLLVQALGDQVDHDLGVGLGLEVMA